MIQCQMFYAFVQTNNTCSKSIIKALMCATDQSNRDVLLSSRPRTRKTFHKGKLYQSCTAFVHPWHIFKVHFRNSQIDYFTASAPTISASVQSENQKTYVIILTSKCCFNGNIWFRPLHWDFCDNQNCFY